MPPLQKAYCFGALPEHTEVPCSIIMHTYGNDILAKTLASALKRGPPHHQNHNEYFWVGEENASL